MKIVITGGGTGGHLTIAKAIKEELNKRGISPIFVGSTYGQDKAWFEADSGWEKSYFYETSGVVNKKGVAKVLSLIAILKATYRAWRLLKDEKIDAVFSVGGYSAAPASFAAILAKKRFFLHEQNAVMGRLNTLLASKSTMLFSSYHDKHPFAYPVREVFFDQARVRKEIKTLIFLGGSQGARAINDFAISLAPLLKERGIKVIHQCGSRELEKCQKFYHDSGIDVDLFDFSTQLVSKIKEADFAVCRAGASTVWELTASQLPALFIPYPYAAGDHQYHNAKFLVDQNLAFLSREDDLDISLLESILSSDIEKISKQLGSMVEREGAKKIVDVILNDPIKRATTSEA